MLQKFSNLIAYLDSVARLVIGAIVQSAASINNKRDLFIVNRFDEEKPRNLAKVLIGPFIK